MQNLANFTSAEGVVVGSALLILCAAPTVLAWSDARRRRRAVAEAAARERAIAEAAARQALLPGLSGQVPVRDLADPHQLWDEPTVTVESEVLTMAPAMAAVIPVFEMPTESSAPPALEAPPVVAELTESLVADEPAPPAIADVNQSMAAAEMPAPLSIAGADEPPRISAATEPRVEAVPEPAPVQRFEFCLQELRRVRLPNWPPAEVHADPVRSEVWHEGERLAAQRQREIGEATLVSSQRAQSSCLGSAEADATSIRLSFLLFPVLWPSTETQATAEAVFEINRSDGTIRSHVNNLQHSS